MSYTNLEFYKTIYHGTVVPDADFTQMSERASDFIDVITFDRLVDGLPDNERAKIKIQKAVCAVADKMYQLDLADKQATNLAAGGTSSSVTTGGVTSGIVTSISAGSESITYASPSQNASGAKEWSALYATAGDEKATNTRLYNTAKLYLTGVKNDNGTPLLYAGI